MRLLRKQMDDLVDVLIEDTRWEAFGLKELAQDMCAASLNMLELDGDDFAIALLACSDARIAELNCDFRDKPAATNVLSWPEVDLSAARDGGSPLPPKEGELGNIAIAYETCQSEARAQNKTFKDHVSHLLAHGTLHLLGFDHIRQKDAALMESLEVKILAKLGIADPY